MRFVLRCRQNIPTGDSGGDRKKRKTVKQEIREQFHRQLENLWNRTPFLKALLDKGLKVGDVETRRIKIGGGIPFYGGVVEGITFFPLVTYGSPWECEHLDIRFLIRQDRLDTVDHSVGDLDGRLPVLFDALRIPHHKDQLNEEKRDEIPNPCFCLLEDDSLIQRVNVETLHLLNDPVDKEHPDQDHVAHVLVTLKPKEQAFSLFQT